MTYQPDNIPRDVQEGLEVEAENKTSGKMSEEKINNEFHKWLRDSEDWVKCVSQSNLVYKVMRLAYEAGKESN